MSQITRCPACHTAFKVVQDQLRMSGGWVRCGQCNEVFDATVTLASTPEELSTIELAMQAASRAPASVALATAAVTDEVNDYPHPSNATPAIDLPVDAPVQAFDAQIGRPEEPGHSVGVERVWSEGHEGPVEPILLPDSGQVTAIEQEKAEFEPELGQVTERDLGPIPEPADRFEKTSFTGRDQSDPAGTVEEPPPGEASAPSSLEEQAQSAPEQSSTDGISFLRNAPANSPPKSALRRTLMGLLALVMLTVLAGQVVVLERDRLSALFPQFKPALQWLCHHLGCALAPLRQIDAVVIDSSSFNKIRGDSYRLNIGLRNTASFGVAIPSIELTLTDSQDQPMFRRVVAPSELSRPGVVDSEMPAGAEWQGQATVTVRMPATAERFTGYKVLAFYP